MEREVIDGVRVGYNHAAIGGYNVFVFDLE